MKTVSQTSVAESPPVDGLSMHRGCDIKSLADFHQSQLRLRAICFVRHDAKDQMDADKEVLQRYYDLQRLSPSGVVDASLEAAAKAIETKYLDKYLRREALMEEVAAAKTKALADIGKHFGKLAKADTGLDAQTRFRRWWGVANQFRKSHLDGIAFHSSVFDPDGPMFKAFIKTMGLRYGKNGSFLPNG